MLKKQIQGDDTFDLVSEMADQDHRSAMRVIGQNLESLPRGFEFSHFCASSMGSHLNDSDVGEIINFINDNREQVRGYCDIYLWRKT